MATKAPTTPPGPPPPAEEVVPVARSKKKIIVYAIASLLALSLIGGAATLYIIKKRASKGNVHKEEPAKTPIFIALEPFTVNLQSSGGDKYLQMSMTLQVYEEEQVNIIKTNMPQVRSRLIMLMSSKDADDLLTSEGKDELVKDIIAQLKLPFTPKSEPQKVNGVFFTSFVVQ